MGCFKEGERERDNPTTDDPEAGWEWAPCPFGCANNDHLILRSRDYLYDLPGTFQVVQCSTCGLMRTNPRPTLRAMEGYYPEDYGPFRPGCISAGGGRGAALRRTCLRSVFRFHDRSIPPLPPGRMLELGCASGSYMTQMANMGWQVCGIEASEEAAESARSLGHHVFQGPVEEAPDPQEPFDLIVGWMVLEHLHDPLGVLRRLKTWARPGGWLVLSTPNAGALEFKIFGKAWYALQLPHHLYHFTPSTLESMVRWGGWNPVRVFHQRVLSNLVGSLGIWMEGRYPGARWVHSLKAYPDHPAIGSYLLYPLAMLMAFAGQTGRMTLWARNPHG